MTIGPYITYTCPNCGGKLIKRSYGSYNSFGAQLFSDGKTVGPMYPDFYNLVSCRHCSNYFILAQVSGELVEGTPNHPHLSKIPLEEVFQLLAGGGFKPEDEKLIRLECWRLDNDRERGNSEYARNDEEKKRWEENMRFILKLIDENDQNERLYRIEMLRRMEFFAQALEWLEKEKSLDEIIMNKFKKACEEKNSRLIKLSGSLADI